MIFATKNTKSAEFSEGVAEMKKSIAKYIDHTLLKADAKSEDIARICEEAKSNGFASVCVNPFWVPQCVKALKGTDVEVCTVIGFPLGATSLVAKITESVQAIQDGASELDFVLNQGLFRSDAKACREELAVMVQVCREAFREMAEKSRPSGKKSVPAKKLVLKLILECCNLTKKEIASAALMAKKAGFDFVKTSTGFGKGGATVADVRLMRKTVGPKMGVKASGGIRDRKSALAMIRAGATRIGCSCGLSLV